MHQLIQFRQLTSELNKSELKQLFSTLIEDESFNEEFIITSMFNQMHKNLYNSKKSPIQTINNTITYIINEREIPIFDSSEDTSITFESLSSTIVNEIGSYLRINEICNFEKTNRRNFISMRYPYPALYSIGFDNNESWLKAYSENKLFDFVQFQGVKKLCFDGDQYYDLNEKFEYHVIFHKVEHLCLYNLYSNQLSFIFQKNNCNYTSLKHLSLDGITMDSFKDINALKTLLTTNKDLKSLQLRCFDASNAKEAIFTDPSIISQQLPNLRALNIDHCDFPIYEQIAHELNHQIQSLHIDNINILNLQNGYPNLKELCVNIILADDDENANFNVKDAINKIMKKSKKIEQLNFKIYVNSMNDIKQFYDIAQKLGQLSDLKLLQLQLCAPKYSVGNILNGLNKLLMHHQRNMFKLIIKCKSKTYFDEQILNLIPNMKAWITQFAFVFISIRGCGLKEETINTLKQIANVKCYKIGENQQKYYNKAVKYVISSNGDIYIPCIYACSNHLEYEPTCGLT